MGLNLFFLRIYKYIFCFFFSVHPPTCLSVCLSLCVYVCVCVSLYIYTHIHTHILRGKNKNKNKEMFTGTQIVMIRRVKIQGRKEGRKCLFNDALNTFYLRLYGIRHMVKDHSDSEKGNPLPPHRLLFTINSKGSFICTIQQTG